MRKKKNVRLTTPKGTAIYPWLTEPNRKFNPAGDYGVTLRLSRADAGDFVDKLNEIFGEHYEATVKEKKKKVKRSDLPIEDVVDDQGNDTGEIDIKFKLKAAYEYDGKTIQQRPTLIDANRGPLNGDERIGSGSTIRVGCEVFPYYVPSIGCGISLRCRVVQILELVEFGGGISGFEFEDEEGFEAVASSLGDTEDNDDFDL